MNKIEALNEKALEAAVLAHDKEEAAMRGEPDPWADERPEDEFADRKAAMAEAIRAYLAASDAEREPIIHAEFETVVGGLTGTTSAPIKRIEHQDDGSLTVVIDHWPTPTVRALEAENARLQAEVERLEKADETRAQDISRLTIERDTARDRLAEALKALDEIAADDEPADVDGLMHFAREAARRVREGGKVDG